MIRLVGLTPSEALPDVYVEVTGAIARGDEATGEPNRKALADAATPSSAGDFIPGVTLAVPNDPRWLRGPGLVDEVTPDGLVWVVFGQRPNAHPDDAPTVRCFDVWSDLRIVTKAGVR